MFNCPPTEQNGSRSLTILIILMLALANFCFTIFSCVGWLSRRQWNYTIFRLFVIVGCRCCSDGDMIAIITSHYFSGKLTAMHSNTICNWPRDNNLPKLNLTTCSILLVFTRFHEKKKKQFSIVVRGGGRFVRRECSALISSVKCGRSKRESGRKINFNLYTNGGYQFSYLYVMFSFSFRNLKYAFW